MAESIGVASAVRQYIQTHGFIDIPSHGTSMFPYIRQGDVCRFVKVVPMDVEIGDTILFRNERNVLVGHRVIQRLARDGTSQFVCKGDANRLSDMPVEPDHLVGRMMAVSRGGRRMDERSTLRRLWTWLILEVPVVSYGCRMWVLQHRIWQHHFVKLRHLK